MRINPCHTRHTGLSTAALLRFNLSLFCLSALCRHRHSQSRSANPRALGSDTAAVAGAQQAAPSGPARTAQHGASLRNRAQERPVLEPAPRDGSSCPTCGETQDPPRQQPAGSPAATTAAPQSPGSSQQLSAHDTTSAAGRIAAPSCSPCPAPPLPHALHRAHCSCARGTAHARGCLVAGVRCPGVSGRG